MGRRLFWALFVSLVCIVLLAALPGVSAAESDERWDSFEVEQVEIEAASAYMLDASTGTRLFGMSEHERRAPASMTKIATMVIVFEAVESGEITLQEHAVVSPRASGMGGSQIYLETGEEMSVDDLLRAVAVASANDASLALAEHVAGTEEAFVDRMNELARRLDLENTHFKNTHGLDHPEHYSTAHDMAHLGRYLIRRYPQVTEYTSIWTHWLREDTDRPFWLTNTNRLVRQYPGVDGLKTGKTDESMWCLTATAGSEGTRLVVTVMGAPTSDARFDGVTRLLNAGFAAVETVPFVQTDEQLGLLTVWEGEKRQVAVITKEDAVVVVPRGRVKDISGEVVLDTDALTAPVDADQVVGRLKIQLDEKTLTEFPLVPAERVERCGVFTLLVRMLRVMWFIG